LTAQVLGDALGPRGRRRVAILSVVAFAAIAYAAWIALRRFQQAGQLDADKWELLARPEVMRFMLDGLSNTLEVAAVALILAGALGGVLALGRISRSLPLRAVARTYVEFFRGFPLLLLIFFTFFALPRAGVQLSRYWSLVLALSAYNGAVLGEIFRAGILSLDRGQGEAAMTIGLPYWPMMRIVILPQAFRRMTPTIVSQTVTLLKDSSLGFFIAYEELLRVGQIAGEFGGNALQTLSVVAVMYLIVNFTLSRLARHLEVRQRRRYRARSIQVAGVEDLVAVGAGADVKRPV
jgi:glutamate transport system permease protein